MKKLINLTLFLFLFDSLIINAQFQKEICITIDDLPYSAKIFKDVESGKSITREILFTLKKYNVKALGSVNAGKLFNGDSIINDKIQMLNDWLDAGMTLANHTFAHKNYNNISFSEYSEDIKKGELILKDLLTERNQRLIYFRHPFLFRGNTKEKADSLEYFLKTEGYIVAPVTIDNSDYVYSWAYEKAIDSRNDNLKNRIGTDYINYMEKVLKYYENQSEKLFGYNLKHIILMHANMLNMDYLDNLLSMFVRNGYKFITIEEALTDDAYSSRDEFYSKAGISWLHRWAKTQGKKKDFFTGEPEPEDYITEFAK